MSNGFDANIGFTHRQADVLFLSAPWVPPRTESGSRRVQDAITGTCPGEPCFGHRHSKLTLSLLTFGVTQPGGGGTQSTCHQGQFPITFPGSPEKSSVGGGGAWPCGRCSAGRAQK